MKTWDGVFMHTPIPLLYEMLFNQIEALCQHPDFCSLHDFMKSEAEMKISRCDMKARIGTRLKHRARSKNTSQMWMVEGKGEEMPTERSCKDIERRNVRM